MSQRGMRGYDCPTSSPKRLLIAVTTGLTLVTGGCATLGGEQSTTQSGTNTAHPTPKPAKPSTVAFGGTWQWDDWLSVQISQPTTFTPSASAYVSRQDREPYDVRYTVKIVNGTKQVYDPVLFAATMQSGNREAALIMNTEQGLEGTPPTKLLPGREVRFLQGFNVKDPHDLVLQVNPGIGYDDAIFTGGVK